MQEIHSMGGGGGGSRFFGGGGGGDRRLRPHHHHQNNHQALKCPRCDSLNTKFCYYNNYNLSQPRHFCKNCRRYWTKGGVLRNVPVGGGCRKSKRSNNSKSKNSSSEAVVVTTSQPEEPEHKSNSHSSSESSSLTATNTAVTATAATEAVSAPTLNSDTKNNNSMLENNMHESKLLIHQNLPNPVLETGALEQEGGGGDCGGIFSEIGSFTSLITSANEALAFGFGNGVPDASSFQWQHQKVVNMSGGDHHNEEFKLPEISGGGGSLLDQTVPVDLSALQSKTGHGGFGSLDWHGGADQGLFDLSSTVDQAYWSHTHWSDQDNSTLFHLP